MTHPPIAQNLKPPPLKVFWGEDYATLSRECRQIAGRRLSAKPARKPRQFSPDGLKTAAQAAAKLNCSIKTLNGHVAAGDLRCVDIGRGRKRRHIRFAPADLDAFIEAQTRKVTPCPSTRTGTAVRRSSISISKSKVIGFMEARSKRRAAKPKR
jgi:hypothetical protein